MMSRKDYIAIAAVINAQARVSRALYSTNVTDRKAIALAALYDTAVGIAQVFAADNPRFDRDKFLTACGLN